MSTGKRLAKRSIIGTRVAAPGDDGIYYTGSIHALKSPASASTEIGLSITSKTRYVVRFDSVQGGRPPSPNTEYARRDLIGPGFGLVSSTTLVRGQKVYLTYNGREINAEVVEHRKQLEEVDVLITPSGQEGTMSLTRRIDEIRLLESRKSARLADQDTDFARLADMAGDRKRAASHSIEVPHVPGSRKRRPSTSSDYERSYSGGGSAGTSSGSGNSNPVWPEGMGVHRCGREGCNGFNDRGDCMDECTAALVLMSLSCSPHSPHAMYYQQNYGSWSDRGTNAPMAGSPGAGGASSSSSSGESWRTGTPSPSLSEDGAPTNGSIWPTPAQHPSHNQLAYPCIVSGLPFEGTTNGALDEGIVPDYLEDVHPQKKKSRPRIKRVLVENNFPANRKKLYKCNWRGCGKIKATCNLIEDHVRQVHLRKPRDMKAKIKDEEFYYDELTLDHVSSPPTMSHRDMARPPHEDPEYQKLLRLEAAPVAMISSSNNNTSNCSNNNNNNNSSTNVTNLTVPGGVIRDGSNKIFTFGASPTPPQQFPQQPEQQHRNEDQEQDQEEEDEQQQQQLQHQLEQQQPQQPQQQQKLNPSIKHIKLSPRPLQVCQQNVRLVTVSTGKITSSRKARSDTKKCRKIYGMTNRELWCTQCKWKKACTRFGE